MLKSSVVVVLYSSKFYSPMSFSYNLFFFWWYNGKEDRKRNT